MLMGLGLGFVRSWRRDKVLPLLVLVLVLVHVGLWVKR